MVSLRTVILALHLTYADYCMPGGGFQLMTLQKVFSKARSSHYDRIGADAATALILDSAPGDKGLSSSLALAKAAHPVLRIILWPIIIVLYAVFYITNWLGGHPPIFEELRSTLNSPTLLFLTHATPRLYLYSESDA